MGEKVVLAVKWITSYAGKLLTSSQRAVNEQSTNSQRAVNEQSTSSQRAVNEQSTSSQADYVFRMLTSFRVGRSHGKYGNDQKRRQWCHLLLYFFRRHTFHCRFRKNFSASFYTFLAFYRRCACASRILLQRHQNSCVQISSKRCVRRHTSRKKSNSLEIRFNGQRDELFALYGL